MKYSQIIGVAAALVLVVSCFLNWAWYPDIKEYFTGFYSHNNSYGKPAKVFIFFSSIAVIFFLLPKIWAKRWNIFICVLILAFAINSFIRFSSCYRGICPLKQIGLWVMLVSAVLMMLAALLPDISLDKKKNNLPE